MSLNKKFIYGHKHGRHVFKSYNIDGYIIPKNDEFFGEYVDHKNDRLNFISSFTGSAGYALILKKKSYLFVDGRYTLQAKNESKKNFVVQEIHKIKPSKVLKKIDKKLKIGFDPKLFSEYNLINNFKTKNTTLVPIEKNLIDKIWVNRSKLKINNGSKIIFVGARTKDFFSLFSSINLAAI